MRKARTGAGLRRASTAERDAITRLLQRVEEIGGDQSAATIERVRETLHAAAGDVEVGEAVASGRLAKEQQLVGFGGVALTADDGKSRTRASTKQRDENRQRGRDRDAAKRKLQQAEQAHG